jgi:hypothetical protein
MRFSAIVLLSAIGLAMAAPAAEPAIDGEELMARQSTLGCVYGNNQCPAKCRAVYGRSCPGSYVSFFLRRCIAS